LPYAIAPARLVHITVGDATGGGHLHGAAGPGSKFPAAWGPSQIEAAILLVAPLITNWVQQPNQNWRGFGPHPAGIRITVIRYPVQIAGTWMVCTAWPT